MRDPMVAANGERVSIKDVVRLGAGFTFSLILTGIVWTALSSILVPQLVDQIAPDQRASFIGLINAVGSVIALVANIVFGTFSDLTRSRFGKRTLWIASGGVLCGLCVFGLTVADSLPMILLLWCGIQLFYNWMNAPFVATMADRVPDKFRGTVSSFMGGGGVLGQTAGALVGSMLINDIPLGFSWAPSASVWSASSSSAYGPARPPTSTNSASRSTCATCCAPSCRRTAKAPATSTTRCSAA